VYAFVLHGVLILCVFACRLYALREDYEQEPMSDLHGEEFDGSEQQWEGKWSLTHIAPL